MGSVEKCNKINIYSSMTKADIVNEISKKTGVEKTQVLSIVEAFMESVRNSVSSNEDVFLRGFGSFIAKDRAEKIARNITLESKITIPAHKVPAFKPSKSFTAMLAGLPVDPDKKRRKKVQE